jgi:hypothetical protein
MKGDIMNKQTIAEKLEKSILDRVRGLLVLLPNYISTDNKDVFNTVCKSIGKITADAFTEAESLGCRDFFSGWRRLLTPWWIGSYGTWEYAYGEGFTWGQFLDCIIDDNCNSVEVFKDQEIPKILFYDKDNKPQFIIELSRED